FEHYQTGLRARLDPTADNIQTVFEIVRSNPKRIVFAEGEEDRTIRAAIAFRSAGLGEPILVGREDSIKETAQQAGLTHLDGIRIENAAISETRDVYIDQLYARLQRRGHLQRDVARLVNQNRNVFAACMVQNGDADAVVTGLTRPFGISHGEISLVFDSLPGHTVFGLSVLMSRGRTVFVSDSTVHERPNVDAMIDMAIQSADRARRMGHEPRVAFLSFSNFGQPERGLNKDIRKVVSAMDERAAQGETFEFEYDGEMAADVALDSELMDRLYPFNRLSGPANVLIMPGLHSANIGAKMLEKLGGARLIGPLLMGMEKPVQIVQMGATVNDLVTAAAFAAQDALT
ncbi:MAG: phosphate acyltransferase, partial [Pseudomonadota bacterium]